jgi:hypothetical protein
MRTLTLLFAAVVGSIFISFVAFKKDTAVMAATPSNIEKTSMLVLKKWKMTDETVVMKGKSVRTYNDYKACFQDDIYTFLHDGNIIIDDNQVKCPNAQSQTTKGLWARNLEDKNKIEVAVSMQFTAEILTINKTTMVWKFQNQVGDVITQTFTRQ